MAAVTAYYALQCNFNAGEISNEVANQVTLDKYKYALLKAENALIRPFGPVYKRPGTKYITEVKTPGTDYAPIIITFNLDDESDAIIELGDKFLRVIVNGKVVSNNTTPFTFADLSSVRFTQSADTMFFASGKYPVKKLTHNATDTWSVSDFTIDIPYFDASLVEATENCTITPSAKSGTVTLTANESIFTSSMVGHWMELDQEVESSSVVVAFKSATTSSSLYVEGSWSIITHGTWTGRLLVERSVDNGTTWKQYRSYTSSDDFNPNESGSVSDGMYIRMRMASYTSGTCNATLTVLPYTQTGRCKITAYSSATKVTASVVKAFGTTEATSNWRLSSWGGYSGYPRTVSFFQDRLIFGGTARQPYMVWMSRSGDYGNFSVEKVSGTVTDDSAIGVSFISRKEFEIRHLIPSMDLLVLTSGNEWIVSGSDTVTPSKVVPKMQTTRGVSDVEPMLIGNKAIYVQAHGNVVRDMGYSFDSDSYTGNDLTLLASHLVDSYNFVDCCYKQQPDSALYFVRNDGVICVLTYVIEQNVYAWSTIKTDGAFKAVAVAREGGKDWVYCIVERTINGTKKQLIEKFANNDNSSSNPDDYCMLDCSGTYTATTATNTFTVSWLKGCTVDVVGDGRVYKDVVVDSSTGAVTIDGTAKQFSFGLPYTMNLEMPNIENNTSTGTMQGRQKHVSTCVLRLYNTLGGKVGTDFTKQDEIKYDELEAVSDISLYSGDKKITPPIGGFNIEGRVTITSDSPYPFMLLMMVREVTFGG